MSSAQKIMKRVTHRELIWDDLIQPTLKNSDENVAMSAAVNAIEFNVLIHPSDVEFHDIPSNSSSLMI